LEFDYIKILFTVVTTVISVALTFYLKEFLQKKNEYKSLKKKLESVAGKKAYIVYAGEGSTTGSKVYQISDIDEDGIVLKNSLQKIYIPPKLLLNSAMIVPNENYEALIKEIKTKDIEAASEAMFQPLLDKIVESIESSLKDDNGELSSRLEIRVNQILEEKGIVSQIATAELNRLQHIESKPPQLK